MKKAMLILCLIVAFAPAARAVEIEAEEPLLPGDEAIVYRFSGDVSFLEVNAFSDGLSVVENAEWAERTLTLRFGRPLNEGEILRLMMNGRTAEGETFSIDRRCEISLTGAAEEAVRRVARTFDQYGGDALALSGELAVGALFDLAPEARFTDGAVRAEGLDGRWDVEVRTDDGVEYGCRFDGNGLFTVTNVGGALPDGVAEVDMALMFWDDGCLRRIEYACAPDGGRPLRLKVKLAGDGRGEWPYFEMSAVRGERGIACTLSIGRDGLPPVRHIFQEEEQ